MVRERRYGREIRREEGEVGEGEGVVNHVEHLCVVYITHTFEGCHIVHSQGRREPQQHREAHLLLPLIYSLLHH